MKQRGTLKVKGESQQITEKFVKRSFVIETADTYPQMVQFELAQDNCSKLDGFNVGDTIDVEFNLRGREWTNPQGEVKYFNTLDAWRLEQIEAAVPTGKQEEDLPF